MYINQKTTIIIKKKKYLKKVFHILMKNFDINSEKLKN
jgi:hypothetical protein